MTAATSAAAATRLRNTSANANFCYDPRDPLIAVPLCRMQHKVWKDMSDMVPARVCRRLCQYFVPYALSAEKLRDVDNLWHVRSLIEFCHEHMWRVLSATSLVLALYHVDRNAKVYADRVCKYLIKTFVDNVGSLHTDYALADDCEIVGEVEGRDAVGRSTPSKRARGDTE